MICNDHSCACSWCCLQQWHAAPLRTPKVPHKQFLHSMMPYHQLFAPLLFCLQLVLPQLWPAAPFGRLQCVQELQQLVHFCITENLQLPCTVFTSVGAASSTGSQLLPRRLQCVQRVQQLVHFLITQSLRLTCNLSAAVSAASSCSPQLFSRCLQRVQRIQQGAVVSHASGDPVRHRQDCRRMGQV